MPPYKAAMEWCSAVHWLPFIASRSYIGRMQISLAILQTNVVTAAVQTFVIKSEFWYAGIFVVLVKNP